MSPPSSDHTINRRDRDPRDAAGDSLGFLSMRSSSPMLIEIQTDADFTDLEDSRRNSAEADGNEFANANVEDATSSNHIEKGFEVNRRDDGVSGGDPSINRQFDSNSSSSSDASSLSHPPSNYYHRQGSRKRWVSNPKILWGLIALLTGGVVCMFVVINQQKVVINYLKNEHSSLKEKYLRITSTPGSKQAKTKNKKNKGSEEKYVKKGKPKAKKDKCCACLPTSSPTTSLFPSESPSGSFSPSDKPSSSPSVSVNPSSTPSIVPTESGQPSKNPSGAPSVSSHPSGKPSLRPSVSGQPSKNPSGAPSVSSHPSEKPSLRPSVSGQPSKNPSGAPSNPSGAPSVSSHPSEKPSSRPSVSSEPSSTPSETTSISDILLANQVDSCKIISEKGTLLRWGQWPSSPQAKALDWILSDPFVANLTLGVDDNDARIIQRYSLAVFYYSTNGDEWAKTDKFGWLESSSECTWNRVMRTDPNIYSQGVFCDSANMVIKIDLQGQNLSGSIPKEIGSLTKLWALYLYANKLSGRIPREIGLLTDLGASGLFPYVGDALNLFNNQLSGEIPPEIGLLTNLRTFSLGSNDFSGSIPDPICALRNTSLSELYADCTNCPNGIAGAGECCNPICFP
ncbi:hypothetical protein ACHAWT_003998 [Skeletonema menzelii]